MPSNPCRKEVREMMRLPHAEGQGLVEYALILVFVAMIVIVLLLILGPAIGNTFSNIVANI
jgi:pilus assembly protein Flp/PilA